MTIPISPVNVGATGFVKQPSTLEQIAPVLEAISQQKLNQAKIADYQSLTEQRKMEAAAKAQDLQDQADGARAFHDLVTGHATTLKPEPDSKDGVPSHQGVDNTTGSLIALPQHLKKLTPGALVYYMKDIEGYNAEIASRQQEVTSQVTAEHGRALADLARTQADHATKLAADDLATKKILGRADLTTDAGRLRAVRQVLQEVGPEQAGKIAQTLNTGTGFDKLVAPDGTLYVGHNGKWQPDRNIGAKTNQAMVEASRRNAGLAVDLIDEQSKLIHDLGIGSSKNPSFAAITEASRVLGVSTEGLSNWLRNDPEQLTRMLRTRFSHLYVGLLPHSRSSSQLLENLAESYWAPAGSGNALLTKAERDRRQLRRILADLRDGKISDWSRLPGWSQAASAAAAEGNAQVQGAGVGTTVNPDDWAQGVPPQ